MKSLVDDELGTELYLCRVYKFSSMTSVIFVGRYSQHSLHRVNMVARDWLETNTSYSLISVGLKLLAMVLGTRILEFENGSCYHERYYVDQLLLFVGCFHCTIVHQYFMSSTASGRKKSATYDNGIEMSMTTGSESLAINPCGGSGIVQLKSRRRLLFKYRHIFSELIMVRSVNVK